MTSFKYISALVALACAGAATAHADVVTEWNAVTLGCVQGPVTPANRPGPPGLLDIALVQAAVHDGVQAIEGKYEAYQYDNAATFEGGSPEAAAAAAAYYALAGLYGADDECLTDVEDPAVTYGSDAGVQAGKEAAAALLPHYRPPVVLPTDPFVGGTGPGEWQPTPGSMQGANTAMATTPPWTMESSQRFRPGPPPALDSAEYLRDYEEVKQLGSVYSTERTEEQTELARFWSVDFIAQWFATVRDIASEHVPEIGEQARLFALVAMAAADSQISVYDAKYLYNYWRPITAIRNGNNDDIPATEGDPTWTSFLPNPPYPEYSSGANCLTASITTILQLFFWTDEFDFAVSSTADGLENGTRSYSRFSEAQREVVEARILQGIHFRTADEVGRKQGTSVALHAFLTHLRPLPSNDAGIGHWDY